jgi:5-formyltetrahydrofolate cyclo-ligase
MEKKELRQKYLLKRKFIKNKKDKSNDILNFIINNPLYNNANVIALYYSTKDEVDTHDLILYSLLQDKIVLLPKVIGKEMIFIKIDETTRYETSNFKIREPISNEPYLGKIDLFIVPGVAFDINGNRLGYGGGYYDKYLKDTNASTIGICFEEQITDEIETEEHDIKVNIVQTERRTYDETKRLRKERRE